MKSSYILTAFAAILLTSCNMQPDAFFYSDKITAEVGEEIYFTNASNNATDFEWDFGDGTWTDADNPIHSWSATGIFTVELKAWSSGGLVDKAYQEIEIISPTMLEIEVLEYWDKYPVGGASVILYPTLQDWNNQTNAIGEGFTNSSGKVIFTGIGPDIYYVDVWHSTHNNYTLKNENVAFIRTDRLQSNELNQFTAYVDYTGSKGETATRDRTLLVISKERSFSGTIKK